MLNVLIFCDFGQWKQNQITEFIEFLAEMVDPDIEQNMMFKSYNPIMSICLCCEFLDKIGDAISSFKHECSGLSEEI
jgi:hypothetical protein